MKHLKRLNQVRTYISFLFLISSSYLFLIHNDISLAELMLLGFISLLLTVGQGLISNICITKAIGATWHPCNKKEESKLNKGTIEEDDDNQNGHRRRLLSSQYKFSDLGGSSSFHRFLVSVSDQDKCIPKACNFNSLLILFFFPF